MAGARGDSRVPECSGLFFTMDEVGLSPQEKQLTVFVINKEIQASTHRAAFREARTATGSSAPSRRPSSAGADGGSDRRRLPTQVNELQQHL